MEAPLDRRGPSWFEAAARRPVLVLAGLLLLSTLPALGRRDLWFGDEVRHASALRHLLEDGDAIALRMNGQPYPDKPPGYFWFVAGLERVRGVLSPAAPAAAPGHVPAGGAPPSIWFLASALSGVAFLAAVVSLARATVGAGPAPLLAGLLAYGTPLVAALAKTTRMDLAFSALIVASEACWYRACAEPRGRGAILGGALAGLAALVKGPAGVLLPLAGLGAFLAWRGDLRRLARAPVLAGIGLAGAIPAAWLGAVAALGSPDLAAGVLGQLSERVTSGLRHAEPFWYYAAALPLVWLPWTPAAVALGAARAFAPATWRRAAAARRTAAPGPAFLVSCLLTGLLLFSLPRGKFVIYLAPLLAPCAVLTAAAFLRATPAASRTAWRATGALLLLAGLAVPIAAEFAPLPEAVPRPAGLLMAGLAILAAGIGTLLVAGRGLPAPLACVTAGAGSTFLWVSLVVAPSLDPVLCPRPTAEALATWAHDRGHEPLVYRTYPGAFAWHGGLHDRATRTTPETRNFADVERLLAGGRPVVLEMARKYRDRHAAALAGFRVVHEQWLEGDWHVVLVRE